MRWDALEERPSWYTAPLLIGVMCFALTHAPIELRAADIRSSRRVLRRSGARSVVVARRSTGL